MDRQKFDERWHLPIRLATILIRSLTLIAAHRRSTGCRSRGHRALTQRLTRFWLRTALWRQWKTPRRGRTTLLALDLGPRLASNTALKPALPGLPSYELFIALQTRIFVPLLMFLASRSGKRTGIYYVDATALPVCHNQRIARHEVFAGLAARGKSAMDWFSGFIVLGRRESVVLYER